MWQSWNSDRAGGDVENGAGAVGKVWRVLNDLNTEYRHGPAIPLLDIYTQMNLEGVLVLKKTCKHILEQHYS